jgi:hypothetical protein
MLQHLTNIDKTVQGLGFLVGQQRPFVQFLVRNWPLAAVAGLALYGKARHRHKAKELDVYNMMVDLGLILSPLVGLAVLNQLAHQQAAGMPPSAPLSAPATPS